ncbi:MAG: beta-ketoacyl synthase N-terminal-like domain-containing protein [Alphaproteobacteria bacterium]|nr:beta-ketoacyl synthase N-terminal-like domain-containing protein [Alphaproteobacteria bacterium]
MSGVRFLGAGLHTHLGRGVAANLDALERAPPPPVLTPVPLGAGVEHVPSMPLCDAPLTDFETRLMRVAVEVAEDAIAAAGLTEAQRRETTLFVGTSSLDISITEAVYRRELAAGLDAHPLTSNSSMGNLGNELRRALRLGGPDFTFNTACTASANALLYADAMVRAGHAKTALVLGVEAFNAITALGFQSLDLLARDGMKPFDAGRRGLVLGEGCSALVVGMGDGKGFRLQGGANACDPYAISAANPDGSTIASVIADALRAAKLDASSLRAIKTHGTASLLNDEAEAAGLLRVFPAPPPVCALKPFIGHTFGACGLNELILLCGAVERGFIPGTPNIGATSEELGVTLTQAPTPVEPGAFLLNYFGFGGNNSALVVANA